MRERLARLRALPKRFPEFGNRIRTFTPLALCLLAAALFVRIVPGSYSVRAAYDIRGESVSPERIPGLLETALRAKAPGSSPVCRADRIPTRIDCTVKTQRRRDARRWEEFLGDEFPSSVGWLDAATLRDRLEEKDREAARLRAELTRAEETLAAAEASTQKLAETVSGLRRAREQLESDIENRTRQLGLFEEALGGKTEEKNRRRFEMKRDEVLSLLSDLKLKLPGLDEKILLLSRPLEEKDFFAQARDGVLGRIAAVEKKTGALRGALEANGSAARAPDPDSFQIQAVAPGAERVGKTGAAAWLWAPWLGILLLVALRKNRDDPFEDPCFRSVKEVERATGLKVLLKIRASADGFSADPD